MFAENNPVPGAEHPKPQFQRDAWLNLNGPWNGASEFSGIRKGWPSQPPGFSELFMVRP
jgi:hypothetical protein